MSVIINISKQPTYDLSDFEIDSLDLEQGFVFLKSTQIYYFDQVYGTISNRSRVVRRSQKESQIVESVIAAVIDAGFCGHLFWKLKLTKIGLEQAKILSAQEFLSKIQNAQQIWLMPFLTGNYYDGTNQTENISNITFKP